MSEHDTIEQVQAAQRGDREAFGRLYTAHARLVHGILLANVNGDEVQDLMQDVFLTAMRRLDSLRDPAAFGAWLATIARNAARMHHRSRRNHVPLNEELSVESAAESRLDGDQVLRKLQSLPERYRESLSLRLIEGMSGQEIAEQLGLTHGTVRVYLHHGMKLLREQLETSNG